MSRESKDLHPGLKQPILLLEEFFEVTINTITPIAASPHPKMGIKTILPIAQKLAGRKLRRKKK